MRRLLLLAALATFACGEKPPPSLTVDISPKVVPIGDGAFARVTVTGSWDGRALLEGTSIELETDNGSFTEGGQQLVATVEVSGGSARTNLYAPTRPGKATVTAKFIDPYGVLVTASKDVEFKTGSPVDRIEFSCTANTIGAFYTGGDTSVRCDATPVDAEGQPVRHAQVKFLAEAGGFDPLPEEEGSFRKLFAYNAKKDQRFPQDVEPMGDEPYWIDPDPWPGQATSKRNPRDGLVTLVAYVEEPAPTDLYSTPYVDANDNKKYDAGELLPPGAVYEENQEKYIWKMIKILWTTEAWDIPGVAPNYTTTGGDNLRDIERGGSRSFSFTIMDRNMNPLSANGPGNVIEYEVVEGPVTPSGDISFKRDLWGIDIGPDYQIRNMHSRDSYLLGTTYGFTVRNDNDEVDGETNVPIPANYAVGVRIRHSISADDSGEPAEEVETWITPVGGVAK